MKKGKTSKLNGFKNCKIHYGTVDSKDLKTIYINLQSWAQPKKEIEKTNKVVSLFNRNIKNVIIDCLDKDFFKENFIVDLDLRHSGIIFGKKSFLNLEITFFLNKPFSEFKNIILKKKVEEISKSIYNECINRNDNFDFTISKKEKLIIL